MCLRGSAGEEKLDVWRVTKTSGCPGIHVKGTRLTVEHLLDGLPRHSELTGDIGLGQAILDEHPHQVAALNCQHSRLACVFDGLGTDLFEAIENLFACARVMFHGSV